jgi:hypothetical protein
LNFPQSKETIEARNALDASSKHRIYTEVREGLAKSTEVKILIALNRRATYNFDYKFFGLRGFRAPKGVPFRPTLSTTRSTDTVY